MGDQTHGPPPPSPPGSDAAGGGQALPRAGPPDGRAPKVVTVYASSSSGVADAYKKLAYSMGEQIAAAGWIQLNGGGCSGLMGAATAGGLARGGTVNAVILDIFTAANMHDALGSVEVVTDMGARKAGLYAPAAAFVALPGGLGTLEELAEVLSWRQLGFHTRPIVLVGAAFWRPLVSWVQQGVDEGFVAGGLGGGSTRLRSLTRLRRPSITFGPTRRSQWTRLPCTQPTLPLRLPRSFRRCRRQPTGRP